MSVQTDLIFDVGVCNGDDSAYYLHKGYRVVGIEANPLAIDHLNRRFSAEIAIGRYTLVPLAIAQAEGEAEFWVCDDWPEWSSFDQAIAGRGGARHHAERVRTCRFRALLERFGTPFYCKIDIEGNDHLCLDDIGQKTAPRFISVEACDGEREIRRLSEIGYTRFKVISQQSLRQLPLHFAHFKAGLPWMARYAIEKAQPWVWRNGSEGGWRFARGSSGPFGDESGGAWLSPEEAIERNRLFEIGTGHVDWQDIHAAL